MDDVQAMKSDAEERPADLVNTGSTSRDKFEFQLTFSYLTNTKPAAPAEGDASKPPPKPAQKPAEKKGGGR
jgi:hypothetical protein